MTSSSAVSVSWRNQGNNFYKKVVDGLAPVVARKNLQDAMNAYYRAENYAETDDERASAQKNFGMAAFKMAQVCSASDDTSQVEFYFKEAMKYFSNAEKYGRRDKNGDWLLGLQTMSLQCWMSIQDTIDNDIEDHIKKYHIYVEDILGDDNKANAYYELTEFYLNLAVQKVLGKDYRTALSLLKDCYFPVCEGIRFAQTKSIRESIEMLQEDVRIQTCIAESLQALNIADDLFVVVVSEEENINFDVIWDIIDWYRKVINLTRENDIEMEAIAHCRIGKVYDKILKLKDRARQYYTKCIELANTLIPRTVYDEEWYRLATSILQQYQQEDLQKEEEKKRQERQAIKDRLKDKLDEMNTKFADSSKADFLRYVYKTFPPKNKKHTLGEIPEQPEPNDLKKLYQKAVVHYHPDKIDVNVHGIEWKVMSEEIVKVLTSHYEYFKQCD
ncbi:uncharacterized protein LOC126810603 [Patella vulgata]|uniref:uncharacterized protein LOC126810603 n=1 Tax=Patella vulgata TaxID=6465 RepID=UPI002180583B|nr:uncharacterized protein LOC126810603 [Patella vulgata]